MEVVPLPLHPLVLPALLLIVQSAAPDGDVREEIRRRVERLREDAAIQVRGVAIRGDGVVPALYEGRAFAPLWTAPGAAAELLAAIDGLSAHGLDPADYGADALRSLPAVPADAAEAADAELLRSHALARAARDLRSGRVDPARLDEDWSLGRARGPVDPGILVAMVAGRAIRGGLQIQAPTHPIYLGLQAALAELRAVHAAGGWPAVPGGAVLLQDSTGPRVAALRRRLRIEGDLPPAVDSVSDRFDATLDSAVRRFQHRHALNEDGVVGPATLAELAIPLHDRIDRIRINLERARWILHDLADTFVAVNIAGQRVYFVRDGDVVWESRVIVGREYTRTPIFADTMRYIVVNPTWTVPRSINGEVLASIGSDPSYLARSGMRVLNRSGSTVDAASVDFARYSGRTFPYVFRQDPGAGNALGRIKFMFPNAYNVYLHDTPARSLFERATRTFSHGCIRVQDPLRLAELILDDADAWSRADLEAAIAEGGTRTIHLERPLPTLLLYWTASVDLHGELHFYRDVYGRDARLLRALNSGDG